MNRATKNNKLIAFLYNYFPSVGGLEIALHNNFADLVKMGYECTAVCFKQKNMQSFPNTKVFYKDGVKIIQAKFPTHKSFLIELAQANDIIFTSFFSAPHFVPFAKEMGKSVYNIVADEMCYSNKAIFRSIKDSDVVISNSFYTQARLWNYNIDSKVLFPRFYNNCFYEETERKHFLYFNPVCHKGHNIVCHLIEKFPEQKFIIIGDCGFDLLAHRPVKKCTLPNVEYVGYIEQEELLDVYYKEAIATLVPSQVPESFNCVSAESIFRHTPVIASDYGALPETIGGCGILVKDYSNNIAWENTFRDFLNSDNEYNFESQKILLDEYSNSKILHEILQE